MANGRRITTHEASIKTATVEIKTLTVSGKQVTLAVFRQLIRDDALVDLQTGQLTGVPWGIVNYHAGCAEHEAEHLHIIWQRTQELRHAKLYAQPIPDCFPSYGALKKAVHDYYCVGTAENDYHPEGRGPYTLIWSHPIVGYQRWYIHVELPEEVVELWNMYHFYTPSGTKVSETDRYRQGKARLLQWLRQEGLAILTADALFEEIGRQAERYVKVRAAYRGRYQEISALDQLFIAV